MLLKIQRSDFWACRFGWLLGIMLLLPVAQTLASAHLIAHHPLSASTSSDSQSTLNQERCDACLISAALGSGVLAVELPAPAQVVVPREDSPVHSRHIWLVREGAAYVSRAPPTTVT